MPASLSHTRSPTIDGPVDLVATSASSFALARCHSCKPGHTRRCNANFARTRPWLARALDLPKGRWLVTALLGGRGILWPMPRRRIGLAGMLADSHTGQAFGVGTCSLPWILNMVCHKYPREHLRDSTSVPDEVSQAFTCQNLASALVSRENLPVPKSATLDRSQDGSENHRAAVLQAGLHIT